jgi:hypothetical protein
VTSPFELTEPLAPKQLHPSDLECPCKDPDDQYLLEMDGDSVSLIHKACGKPPRGDYTDLLQMPQIPVTVQAQPYGNCDGSEWHGEHRCDCGVSLFLTVNHRAVLHDDVPYLVGRDYADCEGAAWHITDQVNTQGQPIVYLLPEGAGVDVPLPEIVADFGPFTLITPAKENPTP